MMNPAATQVCGVGSPTTIAPNSKNAAQLDPCTKSVSGGTGLRLP